jgi:pyruvate kinase
MSKTKIIATVGPSCNTKEMLLKLVRAGVNVFRLNFSHGLHEEKLQLIHWIHEINAENNFNISVLADIQGPKLRVGLMENNGVTFAEDDIITFVGEDVVGNKERVYLSYPNLHLDVKVGDHIMLDDGKLVTRVTEVLENGSVKAKFIIGGILGSKKGINLPNTKISLPCITEKDYKDILFCIEQEVDWLALSFVRRPADIQQLREILNVHSSFIKVIAKIEMPEAVDNITEIVREADGIMIARGDLGVEVAMEKIPHIQKTIIRKCIHRAKPVIVATQMMESMIDKTQANRSEITDVANAVYDGTDAVMLSGETAIGKYPELVVQTMRKICDEVEKEAVIYTRDLIPQKHSPSFLSDALCYNACQLAEDLEAKAMIGMTRSGYTAFKLSSFRPHADIFIFSDRQSIINQLSLCWGVKAFTYTKFESTDATIRDVQQILVEHGYLHPGDVVINTGSMPLNEQGIANMVKISVV